MKINDSNLPSPPSPGVLRPRGVDRAVPTDPPPGVAADDETSCSLHLSELVRSLRALASESPERQTRLEQLARAYAQGAYEVDAEATAAAIVKDALR